MDDDQVNLEEIADSKRRREAARLAEINGSAAHTVPTASTTIAPRPVQPGNETAPRQWVKHVAKWLGKKSTLMQTRRDLTLRKKPTAL